MAFNRSPAPEAQAVANRILDKGRHAHLRRNSVELQFRFRDDEPKGGGQPVWAGVQVVGGWSAYDKALAEGKVLKDDDGNPVPPKGYFRLWYSKPVWDGLSEEDREALVDWTLCQAQSGVAEKSGRVILSKRDADVKIFHDNIGEYGPWHEGVAQVVALIAKGAQQELPLEDAEETDTNVAAVQTMVYNTPVGPSDVVAPEVQGEVEVPGGFVALQCGHEMAADEFAKGMTCPHCDASEIIHRANGTNGNGHHKPEGEEPKSITVPKGGRKKKAAEVPEAVE